jgi:hypothetical protein
MNQPKVLHLTLQKKWFDQILDGTKTIEYREYKKYYIDRLLIEDGSYKQYDVIHFRNGYHSDAPYIVVELKKIKIKRLSWLSKEKEFRLYLGNILETGNLKEININPST